MATAQVKHHDYHLVDPSPWPLVGSIAAGVMAMGGVLFMHGHGFAVNRPAVVQLRDGYLQTGDVILPILHNVR